MPQKSRARAWQKACCRCKAADKAVTVSSQVAVIDMSVVCICRLLHAGCPEECQGHSRGAASQAQAAGGKALGGEHCFVGAARWNNMHDAVRTASTALLRATGAVTRAHDCPCSCGICSSNGMSQPMDFCALCAIAVCNMLWHSVGSPTASVAASSWQATLHHTVFSTAATAGLAGGVCTSHRAAANSCAAAEAAAGGPAGSRRQCTRGSSAAHRVRNSST